MSENTGGSSADIEHEYQVDTTGGNSGSPILWNSQNLAIGDKIEIVPGYADFTTVMHDQFYGFRGDRVEVVWPILGRGKLH